MLQPSCYLCQSLLSIFSLSSLLPMSFLFPPYWKVTVYFKMQKISSVGKMNEELQLTSIIFFLALSLFSQCTLYLSLTSFMLLFPLQYHHGLLTCWPICMYVRAALLCPSSLAWLLSCESFLLVFGIHGNASFHEELSVYADQELLPFLFWLPSFSHSAPPALHSSPFPYITLFSTSTPTPFFIAFSLHFLHLPCDSRSVELFYISFRTPIFYLHF